MARSTSSTWNQLQRKKSGDMAAENNASQTARIAPHGVVAGPRASAIQKAHGSGGGRLALGLGVLAALAALAVVALPKLMAVLPAALPAAVSGCAAGTKSMSRLELVFGLSRANGLPVAETDWQTFVDLEITPRFPAGLTVLGGQGQWRTPARVIVKEPSKVVIIWYERSPETDKRIEIIRQIYKARFSQESVVRVDSSSCVSF